MKTVNLNDEVSIISINKLPEKTIKRLKRNSKREEKLTVQKKTKSKPKKSRKNKEKLKTATKKLKKSKKSSKDAGYVNSGETPDVIHNMLECQLTEYSEDDSDVTATMKATLNNSYNMLPTCPEEQAEVLSKLAEHALIKLEAMSSESRRKSLSAIFENRIEFNSEVN